MLMSKTIDLLCKARPIPLFYQHSSTYKRHLLSLMRMIEDFYPYIFSEDLYIFSIAGATAKATPVAEKVVNAAIEKTIEHSVVKAVQAPIAPQAPWTVIQAGQSSALCIVFWGKKTALQTSDRDLLNNILKACKLNPSDIAFLEADTINGLLFTDELPASKAIVFCDAEALQKAKQAQLNVYQANTVSGKQLLLSDPLSALAQNTALKANLWKALQALLGIS